MKPGIYNNISNEDYHASAGISRSGILRFRTSPLHYWHDYINPMADIGIDTPALILGNALHTFILEPLLFGERFIICDKVDRRTAHGKEYWSTLQSSKGTRKIIDVEDYKQVQLIAENIYQHPEAKALIADAVYENSIYWKDQFTGVLCKSRPDIMRKNCIVDIKTTDDAHHDTFRFSVRKYGYHVQAAMLLDGMNNIKGTNHNSFIIIAVEKKPPYAVAVYVLDEASIDVGREIYKSTLVDYKKCLDEYRWPSYATQTISI